MARCGHKNQLLLLLLAREIDLHCTTRRITPLILLIDNYDSFVFNVARYFERLGQRTMVVRNDAIDAEGVRRMRPAAIVLSPGPCTPSAAGCSLDVVRELHRETPILGVCLGHQAIGQAFGAAVVRAGQPVLSGSQAIAIYA